jgi:hypothetical protein
MTKDLESVIAASADSNADDEHDPEVQTIAYEQSQLSALIPAAGRSRHRPNLCSARPHRQRLSQPARAVR